MNLNKALPFQTASVDVVYGSHIFEHLNRASAKFFLEESLRVLRPEDVIRLVVPDFHELCKNYIRGFHTGDSVAAEKLLTVVNMHQDGAYESKRSHLESWLNSLQGYPNKRKYMYKRLSLVKLLEGAGFKLTLPKEYAESEHKLEIQEVEATAEGVSAIYLEARR